MPFRLESPAFSQNGDIPSRYTCQGEDISPPLIWKDVPQGTKSFVLIIDDPDAPDPAAPQRTWVHWILYNIPATVTELREGIKVFPVGVKKGLNDDASTEYSGPCPPIGAHRYYHKLYALDSSLKFDVPPTKAQVEKAMQPHILGKAILIGVYKKKG